METKKGFTLIELLVVIGIIGLLSTIVLISFGTVRNQARDAVIKANMNTMRLSAAIKFVNDVNYMGAENQTDYLSAKNAAVAAGGNFTNGEYFNVDAYCIQSTLPGGDDWCIDSAGKIGNSPVNCDDTNFDCD